MSVLWGKGSLAAFGRALLWASAAGAPLAALGGALLLLDPNSLGLGLFIVRSIVERHGGEVSLSRTAEGRTRARVELPKDAPR